MALHGFIWKKLRETLVIKLICVKREDIILWSQNHYHVLKHLFYLGLNLVRDLDQFDKNSHVNAYSTVCPKSVTTYWSTYT